MYSQTDVNKDQGFLAKNKENKDLTFRESRVKMGLKHRWAVHLALTVRSWSEIGVENGARTRDLRNHNPTL